MKDQEEAAQLIHGSLDVTVFGAEHIQPAIHGWLLQGAEKIEKALHLESHNKLYATVDIGTARVARTRQVGFQPQNPTWNESFRVYCAHTASTITISIKRQLPVGAQVLGRAHIPASRILTSEPIEGSFDLFNEEGKQIKKAKVHALLKFSDVTKDPCWNSGIKLPKFNGIENAYFHERKGCDVTLYQNSHLSNGFRPNIHLSDGEMYQPQRLWEDLYNSIVDAKHFVYVAGWSVNTKITLVRDPERMIPGAENVTIGELLKRKADEGVTVLVMIWQDRTSISVLGNAGLMKTHDEETNKYFEGSNVKCFLCPRNADRSLTAVQSVEVYTEFTHHQKIVCLDAPVSENISSSARKVVSFIGGIDLSDGRYDNEIHSLFQNLDTTYKNDFLQGNFPEASLQFGGPREPWHDDHSRIEGAAAWDVLTNFEQRWMKQAPNEINNKLLHIRELPDVFPLPSESGNGQNSWNVQIFRSIDDSSVVGFPSDPAEASRLGLVSGKDVTIDQSIHSGYIEAIRRAKRFIYIENQYFMGSCASWPDKEDWDSGCLNLVPIEIALKIASKVKNGERFAVYVITPMWPEGKPESESVQAILHWNRGTIEMMYGIVVKAIDEAGLGGKVHPCDYLNFYCLGNREVKREGEYVAPEQPTDRSDYYTAQVNRRFMIYVHAKCMIVDDEYVIMGSANLNQRSLEGSRDTEIAHGSYQPAHLNTQNGNACGQIHGYRMSLWYEHFMSHCIQMQNVFLKPESIECVKTVKQISENLWDKYVGDEIVDLPGHLLPFPVRVSQTGELSELTENEKFPDTDAKIKGERSLAIPPIITT